jgi:hypothetical protein
VSGTRWLRWVLVAAYLAVASAWIYLDFARPASSSYSEGPSPLGVVLLGLAGFTIGFLLGRWWALLLALALVPLSVAAGDTLGEGPVWAYVLYIYAPFACVTLAAGVGARRVTERAKRS